MNIDLAAVHQTVLEYSVTDYDYLRGHFPDGSCIVLGFGCEPCMSYLCRVNSAKLGAIIPPDGWRSPGGIVL